jgi:hypothetical protein
MENEMRIITPHHVEEWKCKGWRVLGKTRDSDIMIYMPTHVAPVPN